MRSAFAARTLRVSYDCPEEIILRRSRRDRAPCTIWRDQGLLIATEGNTTDFKFIEAEILALASRFVVTELAYDRTFAGEIVRNLQDEGLSLVEFGQGFSQHWAGRRGIHAPPGGASRFTPTPTGLVFRCPSGRFILCR
jgi:hypothetical protein